MTDAQPVVARGLVKRYGDIVAVAGVDLTVEPGDVFGYLGPNGAGKTTSLRMMLGLIRPTAGSAKLFGRDPLRRRREGARGRRRLRRRAALLSVSLGPPQPPAARRLRRAELTLADRRGARDRSSCATAPRIASAATRTACGSVSESRRRCCAQPRLLLLDEPATGLDPAGMRDMRDLIRRLAGDGITILLSSHLLYEVEELCNRVAIIRKGSIVYEGTLDDLLATATTSYRLKTRDPERARTICLNQVRRRQRRARRRRAPFHRRRGRRRRAVARARAGSRRDHAARRRDASLEELFLGMTGGESSDHDREAVAS